MANWLDATDRKIMRRANSWPAPGWVRVWMLAASKLGDGWLWWGIGFAILLWGGRHRYQVMVAGGVAAGAAQGVSRLIKIAVARQRPCATEKHVWSNVPPPDPHSFPSAHTMTAFAFAVAIGYAYPGILGPLLFAASSIALSRVLLGLHYLSDVVAGGLLGWLIGFVAHMLL